MVTGRNKSTRGTREPQSQKGTSQKFPLKHAVMKPAAPLRYHTNSAAKWSTQAANEGPISTALLHKNPTQICSLPVTAQKKTLMSYPTSQTLPLRYQAGIQPEETQKTTLPSCTEERELPAVSILITRTSTAKGYCITLEFTVMD